MFALREPHAVPRWGGCMHDGACTLSTTSTPCAYLHTQSCLVSPPPEDLLLAVWITKSELPFSRPHVWAISVDSTSPPPSASLRQRGRDLRVSGVWCYSLKGQSEICELESHPKNCVGPYVDSCVCVCGQTFSTSWEDQGVLSVWPVQVADWQRGTLLREREGILTYIQIYFLSKSWTKSFIPFSYV